MKADQIKNNIVLLCMLALAGCTFLERIGLEFEDEYLGRVLLQNKGGLPIYKNPDSAAEIVATTSSDGAGVDQESLYDAGLQLIESEDGVELRFNQGLIWVPVVLKGRKGWSRVDQVMKIIARKKNPSGTMYYTLFGDKWEQCFCSEISQYNAGNCFLVVQNAQHEVLKIWSRNQDLSCQEQKYHGTIDWFDDQHLLTEVGDGDVDYAYRYLGYYHYRYGQYAEIYNYLLPGCGENNVIIQIKSQQFEIDPDAEKLYILNRSINLKNSDTGCEINKNKELLTTPYTLNFELYKLTLNHTDISISRGNRSWKFSF